jgi:hypothetical protein
MLKILSVTQPGALSNKSGGTTTAFVESVKLFAGIYSLQ